MATTAGNPLEQNRTADGEAEAHRQRLETIGRLASGVAHDFANLVTLMAGYSEIVLAKMSPEDPQRGELEEIRKAADRAARLTSQLLGFSRSEPVRRELLQLNQVIRDVERMLRYIIGENIELTTDCASDLASVLADAGQCEQVITNLVLNARDAMPQGGRILIRTANAELSPDVAEHQSMPAGPCVLLIVSDTGHGIGAAALERVFEPFFTTKERGRGTGLGLSTVQTVVRQSGGAVWVYSQPGQGATFTICLPRADAAPGDTAVPRTTRSYRGSETILLVEDDAGVRELLCRVLRDRGYRVLQACHSEEALKIFAELGSSIDLVLTDMMMPGLSGNELILCLLEKQPALKYAFMSGYTEDFLVNNGTFREGVPFLRKPLRPDALAAGVRDALDAPALPFNPL